LRSCTTWSFPCSTWSCLFYHILTYCALNKVPPSTPVCKDCFPLYHCCHTLGLDLPHRLFPCDIQHCLRCTLFIIRADLLYSLLTSGLPHHVHVAHYGRPTVTVRLHPPKASLFAWRVTICSKPLHQCTAVCSILKAE
jgi:hypothetical protein